MTMQEYQQAVLKLTEEFVGPIRIQSGMPWVIRCPLSAPKDTGMELRIGFKEDLGGDEQ